MTETQANLGMALEVSKREEVTHLNGCNARRIIFLTYKLNRSPEGDLNLVKNRNDLFFKRSIDCANKAPCFRICG